MIRQEIRRLIQRFEKLNNRTRKFHALKKLGKFEIKIKMKFRNIQNFKID